MSTATDLPTSSPGVRSPPMFEFPKRKRWADLLLTELVDDIAFVLSPTYKIMYCGTAITELLGWKDIGLSDLDFLDLVSPTDQDRFRIAFEQSIQNEVEFDLAIGLRTSASTPQYSNATSQQEMLFDMKFYPHISNEHDAESKCIFAAALPYASRNTLMLNTILDLRADNERLQQRVTEHRARLPTETSASNSSSQSQAGSMYATSSLHATRPPSLPVSMPHKPNDLQGAIADPFSITNASAVADGLEYGKTSLYSSTVQNLDDQDEGSKKKKLKRAQNTEQYVCITCGRTDSPEWRKGPLGPKTLCNACGLRWAKQMRKVEEPTDDINTSATAADS